MEAGARVLRSIFDINSTEKDWNNHKHQGDK